MAAQRDLLDQPVAPPTEAARAIELVEAASARSQHLCAPPAVVKKLGLATEMVVGATLVLTRKSRNVIYNRALAVGQTEPATERQLDELIEIAREHRVPRLGVPLAAVARPAHVRRWLSARGFSEGEPGAKLWRGAQPLVRGAKCRFSVRRVAKRDAGLWVDVVSQVWRTFGYRREWFEARFREPGWRHYLAWDGERPIGAGALFVGDINGVLVGHLVDGVTLSPWRRQGVQTAIIRRRVRDGRDLGCRWFTSETAPPLPRMPLVSYRNLKSQGFELAYLRESWSCQFG